VVRNQRLVIGGFCSATVFGSTRVARRSGNERRLQRVDVIGEITARIHAIMESQMLAVDS
jgi:hypothetical protein